MIDKIIVAIKGFVVGATMLIPGVSGGSMAMILGIYDRLISAVSSFFKNIKKNFVFLIIFAAAAILGMVLLSNPLEGLLLKFPKPMSYFFLGAVAGSIPMMFRMAKVKRSEIKIKHFIYIIIGILTVSLFALIPSDLVKTESGSIGQYVLLFGAGIVTAIALVLPGISFSHVMLMLGLYQETLSAVKTINIPFLLPLGVGLVIGVFLCTKTLEKAMSKYPQGTYLIILGFILGSLAELFPGLPTGWEILACAVLLLIGFAVVYALSKVDEKESQKA